KGSLSAAQAATAIAEGWAEARPGDEIECLPMADGGDGFGVVMGELLGAELQTCATVDCAGRAREAQWWFDQASKTAVFEAAQVNGLALLPTGMFHPFSLDTSGIAAVMREIASRRARRLYLGIGGSATNDGGFGLARALGWSFRDANGIALQQWTELHRLERVDAPDERLQFDELVIAVDVANPLLGPNGATRVYGPQKGLQGSDLDRAEACLARLSSVISSDLGAEPGAGAAGGLGFGLRVFCGGEFQSGAALFARTANLEQRLARADLVITAEGAMDAQTFMGKGVGAIAGLAARAQIPCLCLVGRLFVEPSHFPWPKFQAFGIVPELATFEQSWLEPAKFLRLLAAQVGSRF
ncbi:MAG TPA: glycerate kinase, partial [Polyangiaceae bacterium]|nr:glycerate kinase [Polyangiaceae bacterium]